MNKEISEAEIISGLIGKVFRFFINDKNKYVFLRFLDYKVKRLPISRVLGFFMYFELIPDWVMINRNYIDTKKVMGFHSSNLRNKKFYFTSVSLFAQDLKDVISRY